MDDITLTDTFQKKQLILIKSLNDKLFFVLLKKNPILKMQSMLVKHAVRKKKIQYDGN